MIYKLLNMLILINYSYSKNIYNYYELAVQKWCTYDYMIHGLWPQINYTNYPIYCTNVSYTFPVEPLLSEMNTYWNSCDNSLWEHEWSKHGSCVQVQTNITENNFFNMTLNLFLENKNLLNKCTDTNCILACFDLNYNIIDCESTYSNQK